MRTLIFILLKIGELSLVMVPYFVFRLFKYLVGEDYSQFGFIGSSFLGFLMCVVIIGSSILCYYFIRYGIPSIIQSNWNLSGRILSRIKKEDK